jgi:toxin CptA
VATPLPSGVVSLGASRILAGWIVCASLCALGLALIYLPLIAAAGAGCLVLYDAWRALGLHGLRRHREAIVALQYRSGELRYQLRSGDWRHGAVMAGGLVARWFTVMRLRDNESARRRVLVLCVDSLGAEDYRRLRVYLRWRRREPAANDNVKI